MLAKEGDSKVGMGEAAMPHLNWPSDIHETTFSVGFSDTFCCVLNTAHMTEGLINGSEASQVCFSDVLCRSSFSQTPLATEI